MKEFHKYVAEIKNMISRIDGSEGNDSHESPAKKKKSMNESTFEED